MDKLSNTEKAENNMLLVAGWFSVKEKMPEENQTVWFYSENNQNIFIGAYVYIINEGWFWASSNGCFYIEDGKIITECKIDDFDVTHWFPAPSVTACH